MRKHNRLISHLVMALTSALAAMVTLMLVINLGAGSGLNRKVLLFLVVLAGSFAALGYYVANFIADRKKKDC